jgi:hypothetical protein
MSITRIPGRERIAEQPRERDVPAPRLASRPESYAGFRVTEVVRRRGDLGAR